MGLLEWWKRNFRFILESVETSVAFSISSRDHLREPKRALPGLRR
jgi:hypothetical protein